MSLWVLFFAMLAFVGGHLVISVSPLRRAMVGVVGERGFMALFSVYALATLVWAVRGYGAAPDLPLWDAPDWLRWANLVATALATVLVVLGVTSRNPTMVMQTLADPSAPGVLAITRHPTMSGVALWAIGHLLVNGHGAALIFFGGLALLALVGPVFQERRKRAKLGQDWDRFAAVTSHVPFAAILAGRARLNLSGADGVRVAVAAMLFAGFLAGHEALFGISPFPVSPG